MYLPVCYFSAQCMLTYWEVRNRFSAVRCPSCRQQVSFTFTFRILDLTYDNSARERLNVSVFIMTIKKATLCQAMKTQFLAFYPAVQKIVVLFLQ